MADPIPPTSGRECPPGQSDAWGLNLKALVAQEMLALQDLMKELDEIRNNAQQQETQALTDAHQLAVKTLSDAQSAANTHLLNVIDSADKISKATINSLSNVQANENQEQSSQSNVTIDDVGKVMNSTTEDLKQSFNLGLASLSNTFTEQINALTAQIMALTIALTGRPPVTAPAVEGTATKLG